MKYQYFSIPALNPEAACRQLNQFIASHAVISVDKHFVADGENSFWAYAFTYQEAISSIATKSKPVIDYKEVLSEAEFSQFVKLRNLRKQLAEQEGVPAYNIFTNAQLAEMIQKQVRSKAGMETISGIGKSRLEKYAEYFLVVLQANERVQRGEKIEAL